MSAAMHHSQLAAIQAVKKEIKIYEDLYQELLFKVSYAAAATDEATHAYCAVNVTGQQQQEDTAASMHHLRLYQNLQLPSFRAYRHAACSPVVSSICSIPVAFLKMNREGRQS